MCIIGFQDLINIHQLASTDVDTLVSTRMSIEQRTMK